MNDATLALIAPIYVDLIVFVANVYVISIDSK